MNYAIHGCGNNSKTIYRIILTYSSFNLIPSCASTHRVIESAIVFLIQITLGSFVGTATLRKLTPFIWYSVRIRILRTMGQRKPTSCVHHGNYQSNMQGFKETSSQNE